MDERLLPDAGQVTCAYYDVTELCDPALMASAMEALPWPERRQKVRRYRFAEDQRLCLGAGLLAAHLLRAAGARDLAMGYGEHGKPFLAHHPNIHFNVSHSGTLAVCAVAAEPVGVDVETVADHGRQVAQYCLQPQELAWLDAADDRTRAFTRLWVRKESYIKLLGTGLSKEPRTFSALPGATAKNNATFFEFNVANAIICTCTSGKGKVRFSPWSMQAAR